LYPEKTLSNPSLEKVNSPANEPPANPDPESKPNRIVRWLVSEIKPFWEALLSPWYYLTLAFVLVGLALVYQLPFKQKLDIDSTAVRPYLVNYYSVERYQDFVYRWTQPASNVRMPGMGQPAQVNVRLELSPRPTDAKPTNIELRLNGDLYQTFLLDQAARKTYASTYYPPSRPIFSLSRGDLDFYMRMDPYLIKSDPRPFGVVVSGIEIDGTGFFDTGRPTIPPWGTVLLLLGSVGLTGVAARRAGWKTAVSGLLMGGFGLALVAGIAFDRPMVGLLGPELLIAVVMAYFFMVTGLLFTGWWLGRRGLLLSIQQARWLGLFFVLVFTIKAAGINHPSFQPLDHVFRIHEVNALLNQPDLIINRYYNINSGQAVGSESGNAQGRSVALGQWEMAVAIPYSPLFYITDFPLGLLLSQNEPGFLFWTNLYGIWLEASTVFLLYIIARQLFGRSGNLAGLLSGLLAGFFPLSYLMPSDGGYPTMLAQWLTLFFLVILSGWFYAGKHEKVKIGWLSLVGGGGALGLAMLAHTATLLLCSCMVAGLVLLLGLFGGAFKYLAKPAAITLGIAWLISGGIYYGFYVIPVITKTLPSVAGKVGQGENVGASSETLNGFWDELTAHFHLFPFFITVAVVVYLVYATWQARRPVEVKGRFEETVSGEIQRPAVLLLVAWLGTFLLFSLVAQKINLLHKHMIFALPLFALGCGLALALLLVAVQNWRERAALTGKVTRLRYVEWMALGLVAIFPLYFISAGSYTWFQRVINYILPAGTG
jgi:hypothetical protein